MNHPTGRKRMAMAATLSVLLAACGGAMIAPAKLPIGVEGIK